MSDPARPPLLRASYGFAGELVIDNFAGGGGASTGIEAAIGRPVDIAINHSPVAIAMHRENHPHTRHYCENILDVDPAEVCGSRPVGLAWFSPDCTHHSRAKGGQPRKQAIRGLAEVVHTWAKAVRPRVIVLENVEEFEEWGPLDEEGQRIKAELGRDFREWLGGLAALGYDIQYRSLVAADYGVPTTRRRLFLVARCDGMPIVWPEPTHGRHRAKPWQSAATVIDWSLPTRSIFGRQKPLKEATLRRIAMGLKRYVLTSASPFVIPLTHQGGSRAHRIEEPLRTVTAANRGELAVVEPFVVRHGHYSTLTGAGLREGCGAGTFRGQRLDSPLGTVCATNDKHVVCPVVTKHYGGVIGHEVDRPLGAITSRDHHALSTAVLSKFYGASVASEVHSPGPKVTAEHFAHVEAFLAKYAETRARECAQQVLEPLRDAEDYSRRGLVKLQGELYRLRDIAMRMLQPRELFSAQGFAPDYVIDFAFNGKPLTKTAQIALAGNSVCPRVAAAVIAANAVAGAHQRAEVA